MKSTTINILSTEGASRTLVSHAIVQSFAPSSRSPSKQIFLGGVNKW